MALSNIYAPLTCILLLLRHFLLLVEFSNVFVTFASANTITEGKILNLSQTITSSAQVFELGFFSPRNSTFYLGIWYKNIEPRTVVWVANRVRPLTGSSPYLTLEKGNLAIVDDGITYRISGLSSARNLSLELSDLGNLVLRGGPGSDVIWESFDDPTDTFLPGMKIGIDKRSGKVWSFIAWENENDPSPGTVSFKVNPQNLDEFIILKGNQTYWSTGSYNGMTFQNMPELRTNSIYHFSFVRNENASYFTYSSSNTSIWSRCFLDGATGRLSQLTWVEGVKLKQWNIFWSAPRGSCDIYSFCGPFSSCNKEHCQCLEGFRPLDSKSWEQNHTSGGCVRKVPLQCEESSLAEGKQDGFSMVPNVVVPLNSMITYTTGEECRRNCQKNCSCSAYTYTGGGSCFLWSGGLLNLRQLDDGDPSGGQLYLKLAADELQNKHGTILSI